MKTTFEKHRTEDILYSPITAKQIRTENVIHEIESKSFTDRTMDEMDDIFNAYRYIFNQHIELCYEYNGRDFDPKTHAHALFTLQNSNVKFKWLKNIPLELIYKAIRDARQSVRYYKKYEKRAPYITKKDASLSISFNQEELRGRNIKRGRDYDIFMSQVMPPIFSRKSMPDYYKTIVVTKFKDNRMKMYFKN